MQGGQQVDMHLERTLEAALSPSTSLTALGHMRGRNCSSTSRLPHLHMFANACVTPAADDA